MREKGDGGFDALEEAVAVSGGLHKAVGEGIAERRVGRVDEGEAGVIGDGAGGGLGEADGVAVLLVLTELAVEDAVAAAEDQPREGVVGEAKRGEKLSLEEFQRPRLGLAGVPS